MMSGFGSHILEGSRSLGSPSFQSTLEVRVRKLLSEEEERTCFVEYFIKHFSLQEYG